MNWMTPPAPPHPAEALVLRDVARLKLGPGEILVIVADWPRDTVELAEEWFRDHGLEGRVMVVEPDVTLRILDFRLDDVDGPVVRVKQERPDSRSL